jgi:putative SOS response-associated peptidase YedK
MCGRYVSKETAEWERFFSRRVKVPLFESYNVAPSQAVPVVRAGTEDFERMRWGLVPFFAKGVPPKYSTINATIERLEAGPCWRGPWKRAQRCLLPANGFYEWHVNADGSKTPFYIHLTDREAFGFAGLWDRSEAMDGTAIESCTIITMPPNALMAEIHNAKQRMPAILAQEDHDAWLSGSAEEARVALKPYPADLMVAWPVRTRVNSPRNNDAELIARAAP